MAPICHCSLCYEAWERPRKWPCRLFGHDFIQPEGVFTRRRCRRCDVGAPIHIVDVAPTADWTVEAAHCDQHVPRIDPSEFFRTVDGEGLTQTPPHA